MMTKVHLGIWLIPLVGLLASCSSSPTNTDCGDGVCAADEDPGSCAADCPDSRAVDLLIVLDNSLTMAHPQARLAAALPGFLAALTDASGQGLSVQLGVTSTDLGAGTYGTPYCEDVGGDGGALLPGSCSETSLEPWIVDLAPAGCEITSSNGQCTAHGCDDSHCSSGALATDPDTDCPRCRNHTGSLEDRLACQVDLGTEGCGWEQTLEAMRKALSPSNTANAGFLRDDSVLAVILLTDEDDCSAKDQELFDPIQSSLEDPLGPPTSFRCFEFGVTCDINDRTQYGNRSDCAPSSDSAYLYSPFDYAEFLEGLRDPGRLTVLALTGPTDNVNVFDDNGTPMLNYSCITADMSAVPAIRIEAMVESLDGGATANICLDDYGRVLEALADRIRKAATGL